MVRKILKIQAVIIAAVAIFVTLFQVEKNDSILGEVTPDNLIIISIKTVIAIVAIVVIIFAKPADE